MPYEGGQFAGRRRQQRSGRALGLALAAALATAACQSTSLEPAAFTAPVASVPPQARAVPAPAPPAQPESAPHPMTDAITQHFARLEAQRLANGLMRRDRAPRDLPLSAHQIADAFERIALFNEYDFVNGQIVEAKTPATLRRWQAPVRMQVRFGEMVPSGIQRADTAFVSSFADRLSQLTGHPVSRVDSSGNFHVLVLPEAERREIGPTLRRLLPGIDPITVNLVETLPLSVSCLVIAFSRGGSDIYTDAVAVIRAELPDLSRRACYFEELAQGMGLPNDSPRVRPSLFNDSGEFAVLTVLDEYLLRILYDPRLRPGMRAPEARPVIREIANELMGGAS
ncbi:MAG: DUF2927 domain-containing protein [Roseinatronobacter sp.]